MVTRSEEDDRQFCLDSLKVHAQDVVTVGEALCNCDARSLLPVLLDVELGWDLDPDMLDSRCGSTLMRRVSSTLDVMRMLCTPGREDADAPVPVARRSVSERAPDAHIIMPCERYEALDGRFLFRRRMGAVLVDVGEWPSSAQYVWRKDGVGIDHVISVKDMRHVVGELAGAMEACPSWRWSVLQRSLDALSLRAWTDVLALRLWLPRSLRTFERYCVLACIFRTMTSRGLDERSAQAGGGERVLPQDQAEEDPDCSAGGECPSSHDDARGGGAADAAPDGAGGSPAMGERADPEDADPEDANPEGADPGGADPGGAASWGADPEGADPGDAGRGGEGGPSAADGADPGAATVGGARGFLDFLCADEAFHKERQRAEDGVAAKMARLVELLNYNCWVDFLDAVEGIASIDAAA